MSESNRPKSISLSSVQSPFKDDSRFLVIPQDLNQDFRTCAGLVKSHSGSGAWLVPEGEEELFPSVGELLLIEFKGDDVFTHEVRVLNKKDREIFVSVPLKSEKEASLLAPSTGRFDYRIQVNLPVRVKTDWVESKDAPPKLARLTNLSRGGMALLAPARQKYKEGQEITVRVVGWDHPVRIEAVVERVSPLAGRSKNKIALRFPDYIDVGQREMISSFILQVQRREALGRALPSADDFDGY